MMYHDVEYRQIPGYPDYYAGYDGTIYSTKSNRILTPSRGDRGYMQVMPMDENHKQRSKRVHRLVALTWIPNPDGKPEVHHKDEDKLNNSVDNLAWVTHEYNTNAGTHNQRVAKSNTNNIKRSKPIVLTNVKDGTQLHFPSIIEAIRNGYYANNVLAGQNKTTKGYTVEYE